MSTAPVERYYRFHARIYDATRWSFLFGRSRILAEVAALARPRRIVEVGCGTGRNLAELARRFPDAALRGIDLSGPMLAVARRRTAAFGARVELRHEAWPAAPDAGPASDLVLFSYALSMFNPGCDAAIAAAAQALAPGGHLAVVDFHATRSRAFARWMAVNHVRMEGHLRPVLQACTTPRCDRLVAAYGGVWHYLLYVGRRPEPAQVTGDRSGSDA